MQPSSGGNALYAHRWMQLTDCRIQDQARSSLGEGMAASLWVAKKQNHPAAFKEGRESQHGHQGAAAISGATCSSHRFPLVSQSGLLRDEGSLANFIPASGTWPLPSSGNLSSPPLARITPHFTGLSAERALLHPLALPCVLLVGLHSKEPGQTLIQVSPFCVPPQRGRSLEAEIWGLGLCSSTSYTKLLDTYLSNKSISESFKMCYKHLVAEKKRPENNALK